MLSHAIDGNFTEMDFDESLLSEIENNMAKYLSASELSARNVEEEKETTASPYFRYIASDQDAAFQYQTLYGTAKRSRFGWGNC